ncbi:MAG: YggS family pyridoxal phosphate-dependent enzyme [Rhizobiales bacterium]|nr:YggS family pyridoxal phosphate-dependent enzyme [Hyphomicrobiales bacterium]
MSSIARLEEVRKHIAAAAHAAGRKAQDVRLIAVSKTFEAPDIAPVIAAGQRCFGENRVQEAMRKWPELRARHGNLELHLIGPLQTNKAADAVGFFDAVQSVDRPKLAATLAREMEKQGRRPNLYIQVNTGDESQKAGIAVAEADGFIRSCLCDLGLPVIGLMCIPPVDADPVPHFRLLAGIARRHGLARLSMGMSGDYEAAIACGATDVRVGSAIFGAR